jgi:hypothetical protein
MLSSLFTLLSPVL